jgi:hypothetical protein
MSLLQRLKLDERCGLNYDYMGYAEHEMGRTRETRTELAKLFIDGELVLIRDCPITPTSGKPFTATVVCRSGSEDAVRASLTGFRNKGALAEAFDDIVGWMSVPPMHPMLILKNPDHLSRADLFLKPAIEFVQDMRQSAAPSL